MGTFSIWHWLIVLAVVIMVFGTKRLRGVGSDLGHALRGFRESMRGAEEEPTPAQRAMEAKPATEEVGLSESERKHA